MLKSVDDFVINPARANRPRPPKACPCAPESASR